MFRRIQEAAKREAHELKQQRQHESEKEKISRKKFFMRNNLLIKIYMKKIVMKNFFIKTVL